jgi:hypothetical protein
MKVVPKGATQQTGEFVRRTTRNAADDVVVLFFDENNEKRLLSPNEMPPVFVDKQWYDTVARSLFGNGPTWSDFAANGKCAFLISAGIFTGLLYFDRLRMFPTLHCTRQRIKAFFQLCGTWWRRAPTLTRRLTVARRPCASRIIRAT